MDPAAIAAVVAAVAAIITPVSVALVRVIKARSQAKRAEYAAQQVAAASAGAEVKRCEDRNRELAAEIKEVRDRYESTTTQALKDAAVAITTAAEVQREGNILQREQTRVLDRVCRRIEDMIPGSRVEEKTPRAGNHTEKKDT